MQNWPLGATQSWVENGCRLKNSSSFHRDVCHFHTCHMMQPQLLWLQQQLLVTEVAGCYRTSLCLPPCDCVKTDVIKLLVKKSGTFFFSMNDGREGSLSNWIVWIDSGQYDIIHSKLTIYYFEVGLGAGFNTFARDGFVFIFECIYVSVSIFFLLCILQQYISTNICLSKLSLYSPCLKSQTLLDMLPKFGLHEKREVIRLQLLCAFWVHWWTHSIHVPY